MTLPVLTDSLLIWTIAALAIGGMLLRPFGWPEFIWAALGASLLVLFRLIGPSDALTGIARGANVYLFLAGMLLLSEAARGHGVFNWLAAWAALGANGSPTRLFLLVFAVAVAVTIFLSNDATAVVLTPAVAAAVKTAEADEALPYLLICAFVASAASFVLPISNPANLVVYGDRLPTLAHWLALFGLPALASIGATYGVLRITQRRVLQGTIARSVPIPRLSSGGKAAAFGVAISAALLLACSAFGVALGLPTLAIGIATATGSYAVARRAPWNALREASWGILPLVASLFVLVEGMDRTHLIGALARAVREAGAQYPEFSAWAAGVGVALVSNLINNLPTGLIAGQAAAVGHASESMRAGALIGVDIGPNLSVTGSLATILWLAALRREGFKVSGASFLKIGALAMPLALAAALSAAALLRLGAAMAP